MEHSKAVAYALSRSASQGSGFIYAPSFNFINPLRMISVINFLRSFKKVVYSIRRFFANMYTLVVIYNYPPALT